MAFLFTSPVTINHGQVSGTQSNFTVLISFTDNRFKTIGNGGHVQSSSGFDIRPYQGASPLSYNLEFYNGTTGQVVLWAKVPSINSVTDTTLALNYDDATLTTDGSSSAAWDSSYGRVYHLPNGTVLSATDSTGNQNGTLVNTPTAGAGKIDGCGSFASASTQYITCGTYDAAAMTLSCWVNGTTFPAAYNCAINRFAGAGDSFQLFVKSTGQLAIYISATGGGSFYDPGTITLSTATFYYLVATYDSTNGLIGYVNAVQDSTAAANGALFTGTNGAIRIASDSNTGGREWNGLIDEVRIANTSRTQSWITTEYNNQNAPGTFNTLGTEVPFSGGGSGAFGDSGVDNFAGAIRYFAPGGIVDSNSGS